MAIQTATYRKTKAGEWVVFGPADLVRENAVVPVAKKSGDVKVERIDRVGRAFVVDGVEMRYGYFTPTTRTKPTSRPWWDSPRERALAARGGDPSID